MNKKPEFSPFVQHTHSLSFLILSEKKTSAAKLHVFYLILRHTPLACTNMPPRKNKKKVTAATKSTSEEVVSSKRPLKRLRKAVIPSESTPEEVDSEKKVVEDEKGSNAKEPVPTPKVRKPCTWLKLDRLVELGGKSSLKSSEQGKEAKPTSHVRDPEDNNRKRNGTGEEKGHDQRVTNEKQTAGCEKKEKEIINEELSKSEIQRRFTAKRKAARRDTRKMDDESEKELGGLIFMCNAKTKPDCFRYQLMGVPMSKKEVVMSIKPGLTFFLYDYDLKLMYGVFEASSAGGMKLEPAAFGGAFPAQVRFIVHKDCIPLPESVFKKAIKDSYDEKTRKFRTELTVKQVRNLISMFSPTPLLSAVREPIFSSEESLMRQRYLNRCGNSESQGKFIPLHPENQLSESPVFHSTVPHRDPLFLTEQEYRSKGLHQGRHFLPTTAGDNANKLDLQLKHLLRNPASTSIDSAVQQREAAGRADPCFLSEKDYRTYGLRGLPNAASPIIPELQKHSFNPYDEETTSLVNRYLPLPMQSHPPTRTIPDGDRAFAPYSFREQSVFNQRPLSEHSRGRETDSTVSAPVSHRYSFAGPSLSQLR